MSMPGFVFHFRCDSCNVTSDEFSLFVFPDVLRPDIVFPAWSTTHGFWGTVRARLDSARRRELESDRDALVSFAASLSSDGLTVGVPQLSTANTGDAAVSVAPDPLCPYCGVPCRTVLGCPPPADTPEVVPVSAAELRAAPISQVELSVRTKLICDDLGIHTLGQLEENRSQVAVHSRATESTVSEIDRLMANKPADAT